MNAVGIDVSKGKSTVAILRPFGEIVTSPFDVAHTETELKKLVSLIKKVPGETRVIMEAASHYYEPIAQYLKKQGIFVSVVNPVLIHEFGGNTLRKPKTDRMDSIKIASYALTYWLELKEYTSQDGLRQSLKLLNRQYQQSVKVKTMLSNNLISLLDHTFPGINKLFTSPVRNRDGHEKWIDFVLEFPHKDSISKLTPGAFKKKYQKWCKDNSYSYYESKAKEIHAFSRECVSSVPQDDSMNLMVTQAVTMLNSALENCHTLQEEMYRIAAQLPEFETVINMYGVGKYLAPQLMAEIGDPRRFHSRKAITAYFGYDSENNDSGIKKTNSNPITKKGSGSLRRTLFIIMVALIQNKPEGNPVYEFMIKKKSEGKHYYTYMNAAANKFLRIYYARVKEILNSKESLLE